jgi:tetratricopeptide (TPR) repeat protein
MEGLRVIIEEPPAAPIRSSEGHPLDADLEVVLMTALAKDPDARYSSAAAFAADLENWLEGRPIQARRPTTTYMLRKLVQRNKRAFALAAAVFFMIVGFGVVMSVLFEGQRRERARAVTAVRAEESVNDFLRRMLASVDPRMAGRDVTVLEILENTARTVENADLDDVVRASIHRTLGTSYTALGDFPEGARHLERGLELLKTAGSGERAGILMDLSENLRRQGMYEESQERARLALEILAGPGTDPVERPRCLSQLALILVDAGEFAEAESLSARALEELGSMPSADDADVAMAMHTHGRALLEQGRVEEAETVLRESAALWKAERGADDPDYLETLNNLAMSMNRQSRLSESEPIQREVLETRRRILGDSHAEVAEAHNNLAMNLMFQGRRPDECESHFLQALAIWEEIFEGAHPHMVIGYNNLGFLRQNRFDFFGAERAYRKALDIQEILGEDAVATRPYPLVNLGALLRGRKRFVESERHLREAYRLFLKILGPDHALTTVAACELGTLYLDWNRPDEAREFLVLAREKFPDPDSPRAFIVRNALDCLARRESPGSRSRETLNASCDSLLALPTLAEWRYQALLRSARFCDAEGDRRAANRWRAAADSLMAAVSQGAPGPAGPTARTSN